MFEMAFLPFPTVTMDSGYTTFHVQSRKESLEFFCAFYGSSKHKSDKKKIFEGKKRGPKYLHDEDAIVMAFQREESSEKRCHQEMEAAAEVGVLARRFCKHRPDARIRVVVPGKAQVDELTLGNSRKTWPLHRNQWVLVADKLSGTFHQFTDHFGVSKVR